MMYITIVIREIEIGICSRPPVYKCARRVNQTNYASRWQIMGWINVWCQRKEMETINEWMSSWFEVDWAICCFSVFSNVKPYKFLILHWSLYWNLLSVINFCWWHFFRFPFLFEVDFAEIVAFRKQFANAIFFGNRKWFVAFGVRNLK